MKKYILPVSIILGIIFNILFWEKIPGVSFPFFVSLCLLGGYGLIRTTGKKPAKTTAFLFLINLTFAIMTIVRREPFTIFLNFALTLFAMTLMAGTYLSGSWIRFNLIDHISSFFHLAGGIISLPWMQNEETAGSGKKENKKRRIAPILRGIALSLPVWLVFLGLLYSADLIFAERVDLFLANFNLENLADLTIQMILSLLIAYFFSGAVLFAAQRSGSLPVNSQEKAFIPPLLGLTETGIILGGVILLMSSFVIIQFQYFFSGQANITFEGFTYSEYARRGFGELVGVAILSILLLKGLSLITRKDSPNRHKIFSALSAGLVALVLVVLVSAFQRLFLYETAYGFTRLRTYAHVLMIWLGVYMLAFLAMEIAKRQTLFINVSLAVIAGFSLTLSLLGVDRFIVKKNIERSVQGEAFDAGYLAGLSSDAIPLMVEYYSGKYLSTDLREGVGASLVCFQQESFNQTLGKRPWQSFHFSDRAAFTALEKVLPELNEYRVNKEIWPMTATGPSGIQYSCEGYTEFD
ncbi:MAG: DUF4173 domain-containing protein [Chloroflexi bacterium]|nr:DUF4173 domain-containing protein [Chloroflexota bacterium]